MNSTLTSQSTTPASVPVVVPAKTKSDEVVARIEATWEQLDELWAELECGEFELPVEPAPELQSPATASRARRREEEQAKLRNCKVSVVIPVYNERNTILRVIEQVRQLPLQTEIIVVDDCSTDGTRGWLETLRGTPGLYFILKDRNEGKGAALRSGFAAATGDVVIVQDADLEYDPRDIPAVIRPVVLGKADAVFGSRYLAGRGNDQSWFHRLGNWLLTASSNKLSGVQLTDMETCYKAIKRSVLQDIELQQDRFGFEPEITAKLARRQCRIIEVPIRYAPRSYREGKKIGVRDLFNTLYCIFRYGVWE